MSVVTRRVGDELRDRASPSCFELYRAGELAARLTYLRARPNRFLLLHTEVLPGHRSQRAGSVLVDMALREIRARSGTVIALSSFVADFLGVKKEFSDVVDPLQPGDLADAGGDNQVGERGNGPASVRLRAPENVNSLQPSLWSRNTSKNESGELTVAGLTVRQIADQVGTPAYVLDEDDLRFRARDFATAFAGWDAYYAGKSFLCKAVVRWMAEMGLCLDVTTGGELAVALAAGMDPARIALHGNNKSTEELATALKVGVGKIIVDSEDEIDRLIRLSDRLDVRPRVLVRVTAGVEAHTHEYISTAHEDQKFGFSIAGGRAAAALERTHGHPRLQLLGMHSHIGSQIFDTVAFEVAVRRMVRLHADFAAATGVEMPELNLGGGFGIAYTSHDTPSTPQQLAEALNAIVDAECSAAGVAVPRLSIEPGRSISGPSTFTLYRVGTVKTVQLEDGATRLYVSVDGGMSDNIRAALYGAEYSATLASRRSDAVPTLSRVVGKHCESGDIVVRNEFLPADIKPDDLVAVPGTGAYSRSMASNYNHIPRPPVVSVRDGQITTLLRRETINDLLAFDVG